MWSRVLRAGAAPVFQAARAVTVPVAGAARQRSRYVAVAAGTALAATAAGGWVAPHPAACEAPVDWAAIRKEVVKVLDDDKYQDSSYDGANPGPLLLRLAWHAAGTFCKSTQTGGAAGATMRFDPELSWGANAGLKLAQDLLEPIKKKYPQVSYSDLWIFAAGVAIEEMGGPKIPFVPGRKDKASGKECPAWEGPTCKEGRLPAADKGSPDKTAASLRYVFHRMGFDDREIVALSGAHGLGACHLERSGFWGPWTRAPTTVSNEYYRELLENKWTIKTTHKGKPWTGPLQFEDPTGDLMMLPSDLVLIQDKEFRKYVELYAKDQDAFFRDFASAVGKLFALGHGKKH